jgi:translation initiation factor IF-2
VVLKFGFEDWDLFGTSVLGFRFYENMIQNRPPIIVILGHVDHGKTTLLDYLRKSNIASHEAGGITQSISAFQLDTSYPGLVTPLTFIDTPGHEAFTKMRRRGSKIADLAVLVVAADDGVKPQTKESIEFIQNSGMPFIVAVNKTDLAVANSDQVKTQLAGNGVQVEGFGGQVPVIDISAKTGRNIPGLLELIQLVASLNPPQADPDGRLELVVLESRLDSKKGPLAAVLVKNGTLDIGRELFMEERIGKVKALVDSGGKNLKTSFPSQPVEILGLTLVPEAGSIISDKPVLGTSAADRFKNEAVESGSALNVIVRANVAGSLEAILDNLYSKVNVITSGTGEIIENDILLARTSDACVLGFNVRVPASVAKLAQTEKISVKTFSVIYELFKYVDELLNTQSKEEILGQATVIADFKIGPDRIAGCSCTGGIISKSDRVKILRSDNLIGETRIKSLHQGKQPMDKVKSNGEFGVVFSPYIDFKISDTIIAIG